MSALVAITWEPPPPALAAAFLVVLKGTLLLAAAWLLTMLLRRASASVRHLIWSLALLGAGALPLLSLLSPAWTLPLAPAWPEMVTPDPAGTGMPPAGNWVAELPSEPDEADGVPGRHPELSGQPSGAGAPLPADSVAPRSFVPPIRLSWNGLWVVWSAGVLMSVVPVLLGWRSLRRLRRRTQPFGGRAADMLTQLATELGLRRAVVLLRSDARSIPMTWGISRPILLLPAGAESWSAERLRLVLLHELAHIQRWDCGTQILAHLVRALYWFHPLAWLAVARLRTEQERACDDLVLGRGSSAVEYAQQLLAITSGRSLSWLDSPVALAMGRAGRLQRRLTAILDGDRPRRPLTRRVAVFTVLAALGLLLPLAAVHLRAAVAVQPAPEAGDELARPEEPLSPEAKKILEVRSKILERSVKPLDDRAISAGAIHGMIEALHDPYAEYFTPEMSARFNSQIQGNFSGIGAQLRYNDDKNIAVVTALDDSPALKAGLRPGDVIRAIDGKTTRGMTLAQAVKQIVGPQGSVVKLKVAHAGGDEEELAIKRARIQVRSVRGFQRGAAGKWEYLLDRGHRIGYVQITQFSAPTVKELREAIVSMQKDGLKGLILDLRFCPGGLMTSAIETARLFLAKGTIVSVKGQENHEQTWKANGKGMLGDFPLVVLVNPFTASAAEILAGALKENDRAVVVGARTYGKGSVQEIIKLGEGGALKLTTAYYHLPGGRNIHKRPGEKTWGVDPTDGYYVPMSHEQNEALNRSMSQREVLGIPRKDTPRADRITPQTLAEKFADPQLAGALKTMIARIDDGAFLKVGKSTKELAEHQARREELEKKRTALKKQLEEISKELDGSDPGRGGSIRPPN